MDTGTVIGVAGIGLGIVGIACGIWWTKHQARKSARSSLELTRFSGRVTSPA